MSTTARIKLGSIDQLEGALLSAFSAGVLALDVYGEAAQEKMSIEEMAELTAALMQHARGRRNPDEVLREVADVVITVLQVGLVFGGAAHDPDGAARALANALNEKTERLYRRLNADAPRTFGAEEK